MVYWFNMTPVDFLFAPQTWSLVSAAAIMAVSCYTFANVGMKSDDYYFVGFPALWNVVVLYFFVLETGPVTNLITVVALCILTFIPVKFVHPLRVTDWREITIPLTVLWAALSLSLVIAAKNRDDWGTIERIELWVWIAASLYFATISLWRTFFKKPEESGDEDPHTA
jgi:phosphatidylcholine synthase